MSEIPDVPDDVIERLSKAYNAAYADGWGDCAATDWSCHRDALRGLVAHLRAKPEDAAAVLGGRVESEPFRLVLNDGFVEDEDRHERVVGPWREVTS